MYMKKFGLVVFIVGVLAVLGVYAQSMGIGSRRMADYVPKPVLVYPVTDKVVLTGKSALEFKWSPHEGRLFGRRCYDFRLYRGYDMVESTLIFKTKVPGARHMLDVNSDLFENSHVYTWSLRQVYRGTGKSRRSFQSFRVIK